MLPTPAVAVIQKTGIFVGETSPFPYLHSYKQWILIRASTQLAAKVEGTAIVRQYVAYVSSSIVFLPSHSSVVVGVVN